MRQCYEDLLCRVTDEPQWFDENGTPRYCKFEPRLVSDVYASEAVLAEVTCQSCGTPFQVALSRRASSPRTLLCAAIADKTLHYGDPPNMGCCEVGPSMNSEPRRVLEYWQRHEGWVRFPSLECDVTPSWVQARAA